MPRKKGTGEEGEIDRLSMIVAQVIDAKKDESRINPAWVATEAMQKLKAEWMRTPFPLVYLGCHLELRQLARAQLRSAFDPRDDDEGETHPLFKELQRRYPVPRPKGGEPEYVLLEELTPADVAFNVNRLRGDAEARQRHADALEAWGRDHLAAARA